MTDDKDSFYTRLSVIYKQEAEEHLQNIADRLVQLEGLSGEEFRSMIEVIFRSTHSLKGAARAADDRGTESVCQTLETLFQRMSKGTVSPSPELYDLLHGVVASVQRQVPVSVGPEGTAINELLERLHSAIDSRTETEPGVDITRGQPEGGAELGQGAKQPVYAKSVDDGGPGENRKTIKTPLVHVDRLLRQVEELVAIKQNAKQRRTEALQIHDDWQSWEAEWKKVKRAYNKMVKLHGGEDLLEMTTTERRNLQSLLDFYRTGMERLQGIGERLVDMFKATDQDQRIYRQMIDTLLDDVTNILLMPFSSVLLLFPVMVRKLARETDKKVELEIRGGDIEVDKRILEQLKDPLVHIVRNCIDHGIESPEARVQNGKPEAGHITISISRADDNHIMVEITDDGAGMDISLLKDSAVSSGAISAEKAAEISDPEALQLIFLSGVSTSQIITDLSGRGLGMAIVMEAIEQLGGRIAVASEAGGYSSFVLTVPSTFARFKGILVETGEHRFVLPLSYVAATLRVDREEMYTIEGNEMISYAGRNIPIIPLADLLDLQVERSEKPMVHIAVVRMRNDYLALGVDGITLVQDMLVKQLGPQLVHLRHIAGATLFASGEAVPIVNVAELVETAFAAQAERSFHYGKEKKQQRKRVLIAEDSITSRVLLKNIMESAGFEVQAVVDGQAGLEAVRQSRFDLVVSDVEMPGMNGFQLTAAIRKDEQLKNIPIILVTALESEEDKERGVDAGASAYIVKSTFDQSNLIEVAQRLI